jgi:hypothetical protein
MNPEILFTLQREREMHEKHDKYVPLWDPSESAEFGPQPKRKGLFSRILVDPAASVLGMLLAGPESSEVCDC